jgi:hypothetical protein
MRGKTHTGATRSEKLAKASRLRQQASGLCSPEFVCDAFHDSN